MILILWNAVLSNRYKQEVFKRNTAIYEKTLDEYENRNKALVENNDKLSAIIHRDNKFIAVMEIAVNNVLQGDCDQKSAEELKETLKTLSEQRKNLVRHYSEQANPLPKTNIISTDSTLIYIESVAKKNNVQADISVSDDFSAALERSDIDLTHFNTLICDICENAIHAVDNCEKGYIKLDLKTNNGFPAVSVSDNGAPFDEKVLKSIGRIRITTRKNKGGSGIGLVYIFEILQKYGASFCLEENLHGECGKTITVCFDSRACLEIKSARPNIVKAFRNRTTIYD